MSYPQYPPQAQGQYPPQHHAQQPPSQQPPKLTPPVDPPPDPAQPTYVPVETLAPEGVATIPWLQSQMATNRAASAEAVQLYVQVPAPADVKKYPGVLYNKQTRDAHLVKDEEEAKKYMAKGYSETPFPPEPASPDEIKTLGDAVKKLEDVVKLLGQILGQVQQQGAHAGTIGSAAQQQSPKQ